MPAGAAKSLQPCPTLCDPIDGSPLCSPIPGIFQVRGLEWGPLPSPCCMPSAFQNTLLLGLPSLAYLNIGVLMGLVSLKTFSLHSCFLP